MASSIILVSQSHLPIVLLFSKVLNVSTLIFIAITKSIITHIRTKAHLLCHLIPWLIKMLSLFFSHIFIIVKTVHLITNSFFNYFSSFVIQHPFVTCFLKACPCMLIHLLSFSYLISIWPYCAWGFCLVFFLDRISILIIFSWTNICLFNKMTITFHSISTIIIYIKTILFNKF